MSGTGRDLAKVCVKKALHLKRCVLGNLKPYSREPRFGEFLYHEQSGQDKSKEAEPMA